MPSTEATNDSPQLSVVISTIGNHFVLARVLDGYENQDCGSGAFEVVVVADLAEPDLAAVRRVVQNRPFPVRLLTGATAGLAANRNTGWRKARAPIVLFTDDDTIPVPGLISQHLEWHQRFPQVEVAISGLVCWAPELKITPFMKWLEHGVQFDFVSIPGEDSTWAHLYGANASIKRELLRRVGGYDEERLPYGYEDLDWAYRARKHGLQVKLNRRAVVHHWRTMTIADWQARAARLAVAEWRFCALHPDISPWFQRMFSQAERAPKQGPAAARLTHLIPWGTPWIGHRVWYRAGLYWRQQIAPHFLSAWSSQASGTPVALQPGASALAERASSSSGSKPGGPK